MSSDQLRLRQNFNARPDWSRFKSSEPNAGHVTRKIGPLYFSENRASGVPPVFSLENTPSEIMFAHCRPSLLPLRSNEG